MLDLNILAQTDPVKASLLFSTRGLKIFFGKAKSFKPSPRFYQ